MFVAVLVTLSLYIQDNVPCSSITLYTFIDFLLYIIVNIISITAKPSILSHLDQVTSNLLLCFIFGIYTFLTS